MNIEILAKNIEVSQSSWNFSDNWIMVKLESCDRWSLIDQLTDKITLREILEQYDDIEFIEKTLRELKEKR